MRTDDKTIRLHNKQIQQTNETVTTEEEAKTASLKKWNRFKSIMEDAWNFGDRICGFCFLARHRKNEIDGRGRCTFCPKVIREYCDPHLNKLFTAWLEVEAQINKTITFIEAFEPQGEKE